MYLVFHNEYRKFVRLLIMAVYHKLTRHARSMLWCILVACENVRIACSWCFICYYFVIYFWPVPLLYFLYI